MKRIRPLWETAIAYTALSMTLDPVAAFSPLRIIPSRIPLPQLHLQQQQALHPHSESHPLYFQDEDNSFSSSSPKAQLEAVAVEDDSPPDAKIRNVEFKLILPDTKAYFEEDTQTSSTSTIDNSNDTAQSSLPSSSQRKPPVKLWGYESSEESPTMNPKKTRPTYTNPTATALSPLTSSSSSTRKTSLWWKRPGMRFRLRLAAAAALAVTTASVATSPHQITAWTQQWVRNRGFQGMAAVGRTAGYLWAVFVAYPRMLDRRSKDRRRQQQEADLERRREYLLRLSDQIRRLRNEQNNLDAEIRSFRREIIALKAAANGSRTIDHPADQHSATPDDNHHYLRIDEHVQQAIDQEMAHLIELRADTHAALVATRTAWADYRSRCPPDVWEGDETLLLP